MYSTAAGRGRYKKATASPSHSFMPRRAGVFAPLVWFRRSALILASGMKVTEEYRLVFQDARKPEG